MAWLCPESPSPPFGSCARLRVPGQALTLLEQGQRAGLNMAWDVPPTEGPRPAFEEGFSLSLSPRAGSNTDPARPRGVSGALPVGPPCSHPSEWG